MSEHIVVRVETPVKALVVRVALARGERPSSFVRRAILTELAKLSFLDNYAERALGISMKEPINVGTGG